MIKIDKDVPYPGNGNATKYPWSELKKGESFVYDGHVINAKAAARYHSKGDKMFRAHSVRNEVRIWRTE